MAAKKKVVQSWIFPADATEKLRARMNANPGGRLMVINTKAKELWLRYVLPEGVVVAEDAEPVEDIDSSHPCPPFHDCPQV